MVTENEFEKRLLAEVIPPNELGVTFEDIGALESVKETLKELVMLPLQRPELFCKGQLTKVKSISNDIFYVLSYRRSKIFVNLTKTTINFSLVKEFCSLDPLVPVKLCLQKLLQLRRVQILLTYQCQASLQRYFTSY